MPRQLKEIKNFNVGTVLNVSEKDIPRDAAAYSLNVNPLSENGILNSIKSDRHVYSPNESTLRLLNPISWNSFGTNKGVSQVHLLWFDNINALNTNANSRVSFVGTKGKKEEIILSEIQPFYEKVLNNSAVHVQTFTADITNTADSIPFLSTTNDITDSTISNYTSTGFTDGEATINIGGNTLSDYDGETFIIVTPDGKSVTYQFDSTDGGTATGALIASTNCCIQIYNASPTATTIATQVKNAITNVGHSNGHGTKITITQDGAALTLTNNISPLNELLKQGDYISLIGTASSYGNSSEIIKVESVDEDSGVINIKRGCFGTPVASYAYASTSYHIYANKMTVDGIQKSTDKFSAKIGAGTFSNYSGNNIGGNSAYLSYTYDAASKENYGFIDLSNTNRDITFDSENKTLTVGDNDSDLFGEFYEGDYITFYHSETGQANTGFTACILKKEYSSSLDKTIITFDTAPTSLSSYTTGDLYYEANLLKNHTLHHSVSSSTQTVSSTTEYKINDWAHEAYQVISTSPSNSISNKIEYGPNVTNNIVTYSDGYFNQSTYDSPQNLATADKSDKYYPFQATKKCVKLISEFPLIVLLEFNGAISSSASDNSFSLSQDASTYVAKNDIIKIESEYMLVKSVLNNTITVERGFLESTIAAHDGTSSALDVYKCANHSITQSVNKSRLKANTEYNLSFYAQDENDGGYGALAIEFNGGYIKSDGSWTEESKELDCGFGANINDLMQEEKWINFQDLDKTFGDSALNAGGDAIPPNGMDNVWRRFEIRFKPKKGKDFSTDMKISFASRGAHGKYYLLDTISLIEETKMVVKSEDSLLKTSSILTNNENKELVSYDSLKKKIKAYSNIFDYNNKAEELTWSLSPNAESNIKSLQNNATLIANNKEMHIGFGGDKSDTAPQWLGYINHKVFGQDFSDELYQDEDTVHTYDEEGSGTLSKVCVAGEFERVEVASWSAPNLVVTFNPDGVLNVGDNIVIREWMDVDNSWTGNGVWVITAVSAGSNFTCQRANDLDPDPSGLPTQSLISFRPYFYYGIKDGEPAIYRIWPDDRIEDASTISTSILKGKIEKSLPISVGAASICTFYNKGQGGATPGLQSNENGGGKVYVLSSTSDEIIVVDVMQKFDEWSQNKLTQNADIDLSFKSFKWSNDHINGDVGGTAEVFGGKASESSPSISYAGQLSDILETKGTTETYVHATAVADNHNITTSMFDTRLWIQCQQTGSSGFSEGDRFLFAARTEASNTDGPDVLYCADRTPPTTVVTRCAYRINTGGHKFLGGPGQNPGSAEYGKWSYFYHYYDDDDDKHKLSRVSVVRDKAGTTNGTGGTLATPNYDKPYVNFGYNVGYEWSEGLPSIIVAKYGLFQIADNNGDGVLDGTGVVTPSTTSITDTSETYKTGPYGRLHQRVCGHAVGLIGGNETGKWYRHWGRMHGRINTSGDDYFIGMYGDGPHEDMPELANIDKCIFISTDMHYGDYQPKQSYTWNASPAGGTTQTDLTINSVSNGTLDISRLEVGDSVWLNNDSSADLCATITLVDPSTNKVRVNALHTDIDATGTLFPQSICLLNGLATGTSGTIGSILDSEEAHHWSYDDDDKTNGAIFTEGKGSGHYTKTFLTPPAYWGGPKTSTPSNVNPGVVWKHEKLSFRAGIMTRPFQMDNNDFFDIIVGNGLYVDMPSFPNSIYHSTNTNLHKVVGDSMGYFEAFASKLFITAPIANDTEQRSNVYMCDLDFMFPDFSSQQVINSYTGTGDTNTWNAGDSFEICCAGKVDAYINSDASTANITRSATNHPVVQLGGDDFMGLNSDIFASGSHYRTKTNSLVGLCITIKDSVTGTMETRQIIGSQMAGAGSTDDIYVAVHYPFGNLPSANDEFWIWKHSLVCTAPIRLFKKTELRQGLGDANIESHFLYGNGDYIFAGKGQVSIAHSTGICTTTSQMHNLSTNDKVRFKNMTTASYDNQVHSVTVTSPTTFTSSTISNSSGAAITGDWELIENSDSSASNPLTVSLTRPLISAHYGGLDMRKSRMLTVTTEADGTDSASEQALTLDADHFLSTGDLVTYSNGSAGLRGNYIIDERVAADEIDIPTTDTSAGSVSANLFINQFEMLIAGTAAKSEMGELRASNSCWDKGDIAANIQRYDSTNDSDRFSNYGESSVTIVPTSLANQDGDAFLKNTRYYYKISFIYDGYQEGPLSDSNWSHYDPSSRSKLSIKIKVKNTSRRLTHVCIYRKDNLNDFYKLVKQIDTDSGWNFDGTYYSYILGDEGNSGATYEARTGMSEVLDTIKLNYGISTEIDGYLFAGDCSHSKIKDASNMIFRSRPGMFSIFDYVNDFLTLKSKPTAMANFNGRLYAFDNNNIYRINPQSLTIEDTFEGVGCSGKDSVVVTEYGMFFADKTGAYMHNGQTPIKISEAIQKGGDTEDVFSGTDNVRDVSWERTVTSSSSIPYVTYNSSMNCVLFNVEYLDNQSDNAQGTHSITRQYVWSFHLTGKRWDLWELSNNSKVGKPFLGNEGEIYWPLDNVLYEHMGGGDNKDYTWISKKITMDEDSIVKVFNKIKLNGLKDDVNLGGDYLESSDRLIIKTSSGDLSSSNITYASSSNSDSEYKLSGSNKKGRWLQFKVENMTSSIDSFGILFRRKSTK